MVRFGIALGGGGAKGLAHVLMLEAIDEMGLRPICVAGTSIGAVIGVLYCSGKSGREIRELIMGMAPFEDNSFPEVQTNKHPFQWLEFIAPQFDGTGLFKAERFDTPAGLKRLIGGDTVIVTGDPGLQEDIAARYGVAVRKVGQEFHFQARHGAEFVPRVVIDFNGRIRNR